MFYPDLPKHQSGAALLAFILILIAGSSYMLVYKLNNHSSSVRDTNTHVALNEAKKALLSYAMNYPEINDKPERGPGYLPCPDQNGNGETETNCSVNAGNGTTLGRLPFKTLGLTDPRDSGGERFWYAVSQTFKYNQPSTHVLNSETTGTITVDASNDIVAVIIAPGSPVSGQNDRPSDERADYLEGTNADNDAATFVTTSAGEFNDHLVTITRQELMQAVEQRVVNEARAILTNYRNQYDAYPWLAPFVDPKADLAGVFTGIHNGGNDTSSLVDTTVNFVTLGIKTDDVIRNLNDGSVGTVTGVSATTLNTGGLALGVDNDFDNGDEYIIYSRLSGTADPASSNLTLIDASMNFTALGLASGDIIEKFNGADKTNVSSGVIDSVSTTQLVLKSLSGSANNAFSTGDTYVIRSNRGQASGPADSSNLVDADKDFNVMGVQAGDLVVNLTDGSMGRVSAIGNATTLVMEQMYHGTGNDFDPGDVYYLPRYNTDSVATAGLLSFHQDNKHFRTAFFIDWDLSLANVGSPVVNAFSPHPAYTADLASKAGNSSGGVGTANIDVTSGQCVWSAEDVAECSGVYLDPAFPVQGTVTSGNNTAILNDSNADFVTTAIKRGDIVRNFDDEISTGISGSASSGTDDLILRDTSKNFNTLGIIPYHHLIHNTSTGGTRGLITEVIDNNTLRLAGFAGRAPISFAQGNNYTIYTPQLAIVDNVVNVTRLSTVRATATAPDFDTDGGGFQEFYQINIATGLKAGTAGLLSVGTLLIDLSADFSDIQPGDIVENMTDDAFGIITSVGANSLTAQLYASDGSTRNFDQDEGYRIYYDHDVIFRRYEFKIRFAGTTNVYSSSQQRKRDICLGYNSSCNTLSTNELVPQQEAAVVIRDLDGNGNEMARIDVSVPAAGAQGSIRVGGLDYYLHEANDELPEWFVKNKWHQYLYTAYSGGLAPGAAGNCVPGMSCLSLSIQRPYGTESNDDIEALIVMAAGMPLSETLSTIECGDITQDRSQARMCDYFENINAVDDFSFEKIHNTSSFNDQIRIIIP